MSNVTLRDLVKETQQFHQDMAESLELAATKTDDERTRMLLQYLVGHENELARMVGRYAENASDTALNTWVSAYTEQYPQPDQPFQAPSFERMDTADIMTAVQEQHDRVINLYEHQEDFLQSSAHELVRDVRHLETHELQRIAQGTNRLEDI